jgi:hypothetical protein
VAGCAALLIGLVSVYVGLLATGAVGPKQTDFLPTYTASQLVAEGHGGDIYNLGAVGRAERTHVRPLTVRDGVMPYLYPPALAALTAPLAGLPYDAAFLLWLGLNLSLFLLAGLLIQRYLGLDRSGGVVMWMSMLSFLPVLVALAQGQVSLLLLAGAAGGLVALRTRHDLIGGAVLATLAVKPTYLLPILVVLWFQRRWRALAGTALSLAGAAVLALIVLGPRILADYAHTLLEAARWQNNIGGFSPRWTQSLAGLTHLFGSPGASSAAEVAIAVALLGLLAHCARRASAIEVPLAAAIVIGLLVSPHVLVHDLSLLIVPAAVFWRETSLSVTARSRVLIGGDLTILIGLPLVTWAFISPTAVVMCTMACLLLRDRPLRSSPAVDAGCHGERPATSMRLVSHLPLLNPRSPELKTQDS